MAANLAEGIVMASPARSRTQDAPARFLAPGLALALAPPPRLGEPSLNRRAALPGDGQGPFSGRADAGCLPEGERRSRVPAARRRNAKPLTAGGAKPLPERESAHGELLRRLITAHGNRLSGDIEILTDGSSSGCRLIDSATEDLAKMLTEPPSVRAVAFQKTPGAPPDLRIRSKASLSATAWAGRRAKRRSRVAATPSAAACATHVASITVIHERHLGQARRRHAGGVAGCRRAVRRRPVDLSAAHGRNGGAARSARTHPRSEPRRGALCRGEPRGSGFLRGLGNADDGDGRAVKLDAGRIVLVDWRDALPREASKRGRPAVVVEDGDLFDPSYPNLILVPLAEDPHLAIEDLSVRIEPTTENGCAKTCHALAHHVTATSKSRVLRDTGSSVTPAQLARIRRLIGLSVGLET